MTDCYEGLPWLICLCTSPQLSGGGDRAHRSLEKSWGTSEQRPWEPRAV